MDVSQRRGTNFRNYCDARNFVGPQTRRENHDSVKAAGKGAHI